MDFVTKLLISIDWNGETYDLILIIINWPTKIVYYKPVKITVDISGLVKVIIELVV